MSTKRNLLLLMLALWAATSLSGAEHRGEVTSSDLPVPGATVTATQGDKTALATTDERGVYSFPDLVDGLWRIEVDMPGFAKLSRQVDVSAAVPATEWDLALLSPDGSALSEEDVEQAAARPDLSSDEHEPDAAAQAPDARFQRVNLTAAAPNPAASYEAAAPVDLVEDLAASANEALLVSGDAGRAMGAARPRRASYHGSGGLSLDNSVWNARAFSLTGQTQQKPSSAKGRATFTFGGPLRIPKLLSGERTSFTLNYSAGRARNWRSFTSTMPSALERSGDFSQSAAQGPVAIFDPLTKEAFAGNRIPTTRIDSAALGLLQYMPPPNQPGQVQNYQYVTAVPANSDSLNGALNHRFGRRDRLSGSLSMNRNNGISPQLLGFTDTYGGRGWNANLSWTHPLARRMISTTRFTFNRSRHDMLPYFAYRENVAAELGITGTSTDPLNWGPPNLGFTNFGGLSDGNASRTANQTGTLTENIVWNRAQHNLTFGFDYSRRQMNRIADMNARGSFAFTGLATSGLDASGAPVAGTGFDLADFLLGLPHTSSVRFGGGDTYFRSSQYGLFVQDDWRLASRVTLNFGLRYDYASPLSEKYGRLANLDVAQGFTAAAPVLAEGTGAFSGRFSRTLVDPDRNNVSPRVAIAWKPFARKSTVVRTGYGWYFNTGVYNGIANNLAQQPPFATSTVFASSADRVLTIRDGFGTTPTSQIANTYAVDRDYRVGYAQSWNFAIQQNIGRALVAEASYLGTKGTRLDMLSIPNRALPGSAMAQRTIADTSAFIYESSNGNSIYHGANLRLTRRFSGMFSGQLQYTYAKSIDNASSVTGSGYGSVAQDAFSFAAERGLSSFDNRHVVTANWRFSTGNRPGGESLAGWPTRLMRNWTLSSAISYRSGWPLTATVLGNRADIAGTGVTGTNRADATGLPVRAGSGFFNLAAFGIPPADRFGNAGRGTIPGPAQFTMNASVSRSISLGERRAMELSLNANNILNHANILRWGTVVNASNFGLAAGAGPMRSLNVSVRFRF